MINGARIAKLFHSYISSQIEIHTNIRNSYVVLSSLIEIHSNIWNDKSNFDVQLIRLQVRSLQLVNSNLTNFDPT